MAPKTYLKTKAQAKEHQIYFGQYKYSSISCDNVPDDHGEKFKIIQNLGHTLFDLYVPSPGIDTPDKPWKGKNTQKARRLVHESALCRNDNLDEAGWRENIEVQVYERFKIEVACKRCRKRLWRSEIEVTPFSKSLQNRQDQRTPCICNPSSRSIDWSDLGITDIFASRIENRNIPPATKVIVSPPKRIPPSPGPIKKPDRIHGLRATKIFEHLLNQPYVHGDHNISSTALVKDVVSASVNPDNGSTILYPFLVHEAKREKSSDSFEDAEIQSCFPIKNALDAQYKLQKTEGNGLDVPGGPLVWFFCNRGVTWRVYGATMYEKEEEPNYLISHLWEGSITGYDEALQLILILDYVLDWARDIFRPNIWRQLKMLSTSNLDETLTFHDSAMHSHRSIVRSSDALYGRPIFRNLDNSHHQPEIIPRIPNRSTEYSKFESSLPFGIMSLDTQHDPFKAFNQFTNRNGVVRDGCTIMSHLKILYITRGNFLTLLRGVKEDQRRKFILVVKSALESRCIVLKNEHVLHAIENAWTGNLDTRIDRLNQHKRIYAQLRLSYFIDPWWQQVRELTMLAVSEDAHEILLGLLEGLSIPQASKRSKFRPLNCEQDDIVKMLCDLQKLSIKDDFVRCLKRETFSLHFDNAESPMESVRRDKEIAKRTPKVASIKDVNPSKPGVRMHKWLHYIYSQHCIGGREPTESFLRVSSRIQSNSRPGKIEDPTYMGAALVCAPVSENANLPDNSHQLLCLYISHAGQTCHTSAALEPQVIAAALIQILLEQRFYYTMRRAKVLRVNKNWQDNSESFSFTFESSENASWGIIGSIPDAILDWTREMFLRIHNPEVILQDSFMSSRHHEVLVSQWLMSLSSTESAEIEKADEGMRKHLSASHPQVSRTNSNIPTNPDSLPLVQMIPPKADKSGLQLEYGADSSADPFLSWQNDSSTNITANRDRLLSELFGSAKGPSLKWKQPKDAEKDHLSSPDPSLLSFQDREEDSELYLGR